MARWRAWVVVGSLLAAGGWAFEAPAPVSRLPSSAELATLLAQREAELKAVKEQLEGMDDRRWYAEAETLGVVAALGPHGFSQRQVHRLAIAIVREARANRVDPLLVVAVIQCESSFNPYAVSGPGAMGLMQVMPGTGQLVATQRGFNLGRARNLYDIELNIELGTAYLASLISEFGGIEPALLAYNVGPGAARKILANRQVRQRLIAGYPRKVMEHFRRLSVRGA